MAIPRNGLWLAAAASLIVIPLAAHGQIVSGPAALSGPMPVATGPFVLGEPISMTGGMPMMASNSRSEGTNVRDRTPGDLLWQTLHSRAWEALRGFVPTDEARNERLNAADSLFRAALARLEPLKPGDERVASTYYGLAWLFYLRGQYDEARPLATWALNDRQSRQGPISAPVGDSLILLARIAIAQEKYDEAESLAQRALTAYTRSSPGRQLDLHTPIALDTLGTIALAQEKMDVAEAYIRRAFDWRWDLYQADLYPPDKYVQVIIELGRSNLTLANLLTKLGKDEEASLLTDQVRMLLESAAEPGVGGPPAPNPGL